MLEKKIIKEWQDIAKSNAKRFVKEKGKFDGKVFPIADYFSEKIDFYFESEEAKARFQARGVDESGINERVEIFNEAFWKSYQWWEKKYAENEKVLSKYIPIFKEAEEYAKTIDVSDIQDGFPCGWVTLYLKDEKSDLGKVLRSQYDGDSYSAKTYYWSAYKLPIKLPSYGQCISFDERICSKVVEFLKAKGIEAGSHSYID